MLGMAGTTLSAGDGMKLSQSSRDLVVRIAGAAFLACLLVSGCGGGGGETACLGTDAMTAANPSTAAGSLQSGGLVGDLMGTGNPEVGSAIRILRVVVGLDPQPDADELWQWNCNNSGGVEVGDAISLLRCVVGLDPWPIVVAWTFTATPWDEKAYSSPDGVLTLDMPWYAVDTTTAITVTATTDCPADPGLVPGTVYEYEPDGLQFGSLPTLSVKYDPANLPARTPETSLRIAEVVAGAWSPLPSTVDTDTHTVSAEINGFCVIGVVGQPTDPRFVSKWTVVDGVPLDAPSGICVDSGGQVYVADTGNDSVVVTTPAGVVVTRYPAETFYTLYPTAVAVYGAAKTVCILDKANGRVVRCTQAGLRIDDLHPAYALGQASKAMALDGSGFCYVPVIETNSIHVRSWEGEGPFTFGSEGYGDGQFHFSNAIVGIAVKADGTIYVSESNRLAESGRIQMFTHGGAFIARWEPAAGAAVTVTKPGPIIFDSAGNLYVVDLADCVVKKYSTAGQFLGKWGSYGTEDGQFKDPTGIAVDGNGYLYVVDAELNCVQKFSP